MVRSRRAAPEQDDIRAQLAKVLASPQFRSSSRRRELLDWGVQRVLSGQTELVKEYQIGLEVFGKRESWDPRIDPSVRVEFNRMRQKLREYYEGEGAGDPVLIEFPLRRLLPVFAWKEPSEETAGQMQPSEEQLLPGTDKSVRRVALLFALALLIAGAAGLWSFRLRQSSPPLTTIVVLPFIDLTANAQHQYVSDGITEELTNSLAMLKGLRVVARTSAFQFKGRNVDVREIGRELGAGAVVEGSVLGENDRIRVIVQLNRTADGTHLWQAQYDRDSRDILTVENEIAQAVAGALRLRLTGPPAQEFDPGQEALDEYMKGIDEERKSDPASLRRAEEHYRNAIRLAPRYALAHTRLGSIYLAQASQAGEEQQSKLENAQREMQSAVELDSKLPVALSGLALVSYLLNWDWPSAEANFRRALELAPSSAAHQTYAWGLMTRGRFKESEQHYREAIQLDPLNCLLRYNLATLFSREQRPELAREELTSCLSRDPKWFVGRLYLGYFELYANRPEEGLRDLQAAADLAPGSPAIEPGFAIAYAETGHRDRAIELMRQMEQQADKKGYARYQLALVSAYLGDRDRLFYWLGRSVDSREQQSLSMRIDPVFAPFQRDDRMIALERRIGLIP